MKTAARSARTEAELWLRILHPDGELTPAAARAILDLSFPVRDEERIHALSDKARAGTLTLAEEREMDEYERVGSLLSILKSKARLVLKRTNHSV